MKITLEDIIEFCKKNHITFTPEGTDKRAEEEKSSWHYRNRRYNDFDIYCSWSTGGISGGNCWGEGGHYPTSGEPEPEFESLDQIMEELFPNITYLQYKKLIRTLVTSDTYSETEYYGNSSNYAYKKVNLKALVDYINEELVNA